MKITLNAPKEAVIVKQEIKSVDEITINRIVDLLQEKNLRIYKQIRSNCFVGKQNIR